MKKKILFGLLVLTLLVLPLFVACAKPAPTTTTAPTIAPAPTAAPTAAKWWEGKWGKPKYGGSINVAVLMFPNSFDPSFPMMCQYRSYEGMFMPDVTIDREEWSFKIEGVAPKYVGLLAESWEWEDSMTLVVKLRQGVKWHNMAPTYGREFTADDVVYHYDRALGTGSGFTKPNPFVADSLKAVKNVTARDKYTVVVKFNNATPLANWWAITDERGPNVIESREFVESNDYSNYKNCAGTGPWMVTDYLAGSSITYSKNPNYYLHDERYPDNPIPYLDEVKMLYILDDATRLAAIRSGRVDVEFNNSPQSTQALQKTNPELMFSDATNFAMTLDMREDRKPFDDIRVRKALQLAVDIPTIAKTHYANPEGTSPPSFLTPKNKGWTWPYEQWPEDLQKEYVYDPDQAKKLLAEAGYPNGFNTDVYATTFDDPELLQIIKSEFAEIGVNMEIRPMDMNALIPFVEAGKHDQMKTNASGASQIAPAYVAFLNRLSTNPDNGIYVPAEEAKPYDDLYNQFIAATDEATAKNLAHQMEEYMFRHHWFIVTPCKTGFDAVRPRVQGWSGENLAQFNGPVFWARMWVKD
jgi:peptide/nickel transport system substrate-binding protein